MAATAVKYTAQYFLASSTSELGSPADLHPNGRIVDLMQGFGVVPFLAVQITMRWSP